MTTAPAPIRDEEFVSRTEPFRRELRAHCYRMLGSLDDAEDLVQDTFLRAWRSYARFEGRSSVRTWLYQIATNVCLTALDHRARRRLPSGLGGPSDDPAVLQVEAGPATSWLQPMPDALVSPEADDPAAIVAFRHSLRLALIASLQYLPGRQRAVLILRDVLDWSAADVAEVLGTTVPAIKSALQRARARLQEVAPAADQVIEPTEPHVRALLDSYIAAFESADAAALARLLRADVTLELPPFSSWFAGATARAGAIRGLGSPGQWLLLPTTANGQPAAVAYRRGSDATFGAYGVVVLTATATGIARIVVFGDPGLVARFGFPQSQPAAG